MGLTREEAKEFMWLENHKNPVVIKWQHHKTIRDLVEKLIDKIYDDFEEELKKAYIEGSNDAWKAIKEKNANNTRTIPSA